MRILHRDDMRMRFDVSYSAEELDGELLDLYATYQSLGGAPRAGAEGFLAELRARAKALGLAAGGAASQG